MTVSSTSRVTALFTGNGVTTSFAFTFKVQDSDDIAVYRLEDDVQELVSDTEYTVSLNANQNTNPGGSVLFTTAPTSAQNLKITTAADPTQELDIQAQSAFNPAVVMEALDKLTIQTQQLAQKLSRAITLPITDQLTGELETAAVRAGKVLGFNTTTGAAEAGSVANYAIDGDTLEVSSLYGSFALTLQDWLSGVVDARTYGIVAGSSAAAAANTTALQNAITAASAAGKTLLLPAGTIYIAASTGYAALTIPAAGCRIVGQGRFNTILRMVTGAGAVLIAAVNADKVSIEHVGFDGGATAVVSWQRGVVFRGCRDVSVTNCFFYRTGDGPIMLGTEGLHGTDHVADGTRRTERVHITDNLIQDCWGTVAIVTKYNGAASLVISRNLILNSCTVGASIESEDNLSYTTYDYWVERVVVSDNAIWDLDYAHSSGASNVSYAISIAEKARYMTVTGNVCGDVAGNTLAVGVFVGTSPTQTDEIAKAITIGNNVVYNVTASGGRGYCYGVSCGDTDVEAIVFDGNVSDGGEEGLVLVTAAGSKTLGTVRTLIVSNNLFNAPTEFGVWCANTSSDGDMPLRNAVFSANIVRNAVSHGFSVYAQECTFALNSVTFCGGAGMTFTSGSKGNVLLGNRITDNCDSGITGDLTNTDVGPNTIKRNGQTSATAYNLYASVAGTGLWVEGANLGDDTAANLRIATTTANVRYDAFDYCVAGVKYTAAASAAGGVAPGNDVVPINTYGCVAFEIGADGVVDVIEATNNATGYASALLARQGLPAKQASHVRFGNLVVIKTDGAFTFGTTALSAANVTATYRTAIVDYCYRSATGGQHVKSNKMVGFAMDSVFGGIAAQNTGTYDAGGNLTA